MLKNEQEAIADFSLVREILMGNDDVIYRYFNYGKRCWESEKLEKTEMLEKPYKKSLRSRILSVFCKKK